LDAPTPGHGSQVSALERAIQKSADSGFQITAPPGCETSAGNFGDTVINGKAVPCFKTPKNGSVTATLTIDGVPSSAGPAYPLKLNETSGAAKITSTGCYTERDPPAGQTGIDRWYKG
jgi:hypothetical protein